MFSKSSGSYEIARYLLSSLIPSLPNGLLQPIASGVGTALGTAIRIPAEVVKQVFGISFHTENIVCIAIRESFFPSLAPEFDFLQFSWNEICLS